MKKPIVRIEPDCGNSPKRSFLKRLNEAYALGDTDFIAENASNDIVWNIYGTKRIEGKENFIEMLEEIKNCATEEMEVFSIITHGKEASSNGTIRMGGELYAFCDVYHFVSAKSTIVKEMHTYVVKMK